MIKEKILLTEEKDTIDSVAIIAEANARALKRLHEVYPIASQQEAREAVTGRAFIVRQMMDAHHKKYKDTFDDLSKLKMPDHIRVIQSALEGVADRMKYQDNRLPGSPGFYFVAFDGNSWRVDRDALETFCDRRYRKYATTDRQLSLLQFAKDLADLLNGFSIGDNARRRNFENGNDFIKWDSRSGKWVPNISTIVHAQEQDEFKF